MPHRLVHALLDVRHLAAQFFRHPVEQPRIYGHTVHLHSDEHRNERHFHFRHRTGGAMLFEFSLEQPPQLLRYVRIGRGVTSRLLDGYLVDRNLIAPSADQVSQLGHLDAQLIER